MELSERLEHELELRGQMTLLDPSNPEALNFNEEQSFKLFGTAGTNASLYTSTQSVSLGGMAFEPQEDEDIDSQESSIFGGSITSRADQNMDDDTEGTFIENMGAFGLGSTNPPPPMERQEDSKDDMEVDRTESGRSNLDHSPAKVTRMASLCLGFSTAILDSQRKEIKRMLQQWVDANGCNNIPAHLADLATRAQVEMSTLTMPQ